MVFSGTLLTASILFPVYRRLTDRSSHDGLALICGRRMAIMIRRVVSVALVVAGLALPVCAQRGGARGGGSFSGRGGGTASHSGGFASYGAGASRGGLGPAGRVPFMGTPRMSGSRYVGVASNPIGRPVISNGGYGARRIYPVSYTHLDVYKRQGPYSAILDVAGREGARGFQ